MPCLGTIETTQLVGVLDLSSLTERTIPVTGKPRCFQPGALLEVHLRP